MSDIAIQQWIPNNPKPVKVVEFKMEDAWHINATVLRYGTCACIIYDNTSPAPWAYLLSGEWLGEKTRTDLIDGLFIVVEDSQAFAMSRDELEEHYIKAEDELQEEEQQAVRPQTGSKRSVAVRAAR